VPVSLIRAHCIVTHTCSLCCHSCMLTLQCHPDVLLHTPTPHFLCSTVMHSHPLFSYPPIIHSLYTITHSLYTTIHSLYTIIHSLYTLSTLSLHSLYTLSTLSLYSLYTLAPHLSPATSSNDRSSSDDASSSAMLFGLTTSPCVMCRVCDGAESGQGYIGAT
jgi:hypothetical protein